LRSFIFGHFAGDAKRFAGDRIVTHGQRLGLPQQVFQGALASALGHDLELMCDDAGTLARAR